jgi:FKBP-type peptidyl-prolyl cis-trans isomerase
MRIHTAFLAVFLWLFIGCGQEQKPDQQVISPDTLQKSLEYANKHLIRTEDRQIEDYLARYHWNAIQTPTGLRFLRYHEGKGMVAVEGSQVRINFRVSLINGVECYSSEIDGAKEFVLGRSNEINGLEEGLLMMKVGDKAKLVIPSHLAFGLPGDEEKIPMRATLIYDVELLSVQNP